MEEALRFERDGDVARIVMDDGKVNALSPERIASLHAALDRAEKEAKAVALVGRPERFSAGFDLRAIRSGAEAARALVSAGGELFLRFLEFPLPIVAGCTGHALAAGAILLLVADQRIGAEGAYQIGLNETAIGMTLPRYGVELARARLSRRHFDRAVVQAEVYDPAGARDAGFLDTVVAPAAVPDAACQAARRLAVLPQPAFCNNKRRAHAPVVEPLRASLAEDVRALLTR